MNMVNAAYEPAHLRADWDPFTLSTLRAYGELI